MSTLGAWSISGKRTAVRYKYDDFLAASFRCQALSQNIKQLRRRGALCTADPDIRLASAKMLRLLAELSADSPRTRAYDFHTW